MNTECCNDALNYIAFGDSLKDIFCSCSVFPCSLQSGQEIIFFLVRLSNIPMFCSAFPCAVPHLLCFKSSQPVLQCTSFLFVARMVWCAQTDLGKNWRRDASDFIAKALILGVVLVNL